jgi:predicted naringenin-chalcone synthase
MGCYAAFNGLKAAWSAVRSCPDAKVLMVNLELCTLHMQEDFNLERLLAFMQFADGCAVSLISSEKAGLKIEELHSDVVPEARDLITWQIGESGFDMHLSPTVPQALAAHVPGLMDRWLGDRISQVAEWAVHPGGRAILDAVADKLSLTARQMHPSREILRRYGNMSSATILFVLNEILRDESRSGTGVAMAFGPGLTMESMLFRKV